MAIRSIFGTVEAVKAGIKNLDIAELKREMAERNDLLLVDIRELQETVDLGTIPGAVHAPRGMLEFWADPSSPYYRNWFAENKRIVVFCAGGGRSALAAKALKEMGFPDVAHLVPGFNGWAKAGEPVEDVSKSSRWMRKPTKDERPALSVGHVLLAVPDVAASRDFFVTLGLRHVETTARVAILELRGGTHLILVPAPEPAPKDKMAPFDLMVDDLDAAHAAFTAAGLAPSAIVQREEHRAFTVTEPGGHRVPIQSSHVTELPV